MAQFTTEKFKTQIKDNSMPKSSLVHKKQKSAVVSRYTPKTGVPVDTARSIAQKSTISKNTNDYIKVLDSHRPK